MGKWIIPPTLHSEIQSGPSCFFHEHSIGSRDGRIPRYSDSHACVRCVAALTEGRLSLDIHRIERRYRRKFLEFWSLVDMRSSDECWEWQGRRRARWNSGYFHIGRHWTRGNTYPAQRVAVWFTWGDIGRLPITPICKNSNCCNPLHLRIKAVPHYYHHRKLQVINLEFDSSKLNRQTQEFLEVSLTKAPRQFEKLEQHNPAWIEQRLFGGELEDEDEDDDDQGSSHAAIRDDGEPDLLA